MVRGMKKIKHTGQQNEVWQGKQYLVQRKNRALASTEFSVWNLGPSDSPEVIAHAQFLTFPNVIMYFCKLKIFYLIC